MNTSSTLLCDFVWQRYWPVVRGKLCIKWRERTEGFLKVICASLPGCDITTLDEEACERWWAGIQEQHGVCTANKLLVRFKHILKAAKRWKVIPSIPTTEIKRLPEPDRPFPGLSDEQRQKLFASAKKRLRFYIVFGAYTGARRKSIASLRKDDVDLVKGVLIFRKTKNGTDHEVPIHHALWPYLGELFSIPIKHRERTVKAWDSPYLLPQYKNIDTITRSFRRVADRCGMPRFRFHDLRHSVGTTLGEKGVNQKIIMEVLGHKTNAMSLRYTNVSKETVRHTLNQYL